MWLILLCTRHRVNLSSNDLSRAAILWGLYYQNYKNKNEHLPFVFFFFVSLQSTYKGGLFCLFVFLFFNLFVFLDMDFCHAGACRHGGRCIEEFKGFRCDCTGTGFEGATCELGKCYKLAIDL